MKSEIIGRGAFSIIFAGDHEGKRCAVKFVDNRDNKKNRIRREVTILTELKDCPYVVNVLDFRIDYPPDGYIKYEYLANTLEDLNKKLDYQHIKKLCYQLIDAVKFIHSKNIIHCDIKPENLMIDEEGNLRIIDFGNALYFSEINTIDQQINTAYYMPPEYIIGAPLDCRVDLWAVGCVIFELLTKKILFNPKRSNNISRKTYLLGLMISVFGDFNEEFLKSGIDTEFYFTADLTYKFKYLIKKNNISSVLGDVSDKEEWVSLIYTLMLR
jgi:serine/threonine protein kinase